MWMITYEQEKTEILKNIGKITVWLERITLITDKNPVEFWLKLLKFGNEEEKKTVHKISYKFVIIYSQKFLYDEINFSKEDIEKIESGIDNVICLSYKEEDL